MIHYHSARCTLALDVHYIRHYLVLASVVLANCSINARHRFP